MLRPLLVAWAQQGAGRTDAALGTLAPLVEGERFRGVYALHAAMIADLARADRRRPGGCTASRRRITARSTSASA